MERKHWWAHWWVFIYLCTDKNFGKTSLWGVGSKASILVLGLTPRSADLMAFEVSNHMRTVLGHWCKCMREHEDLPISYISQITWSQFDVPNLLYISKCIYATPTLQPARHVCFNKYTILRFCQAATLDAWLRGCDSWWTMGKKSRKAVRSTPNLTVAGQSPAAEMYTTFKIGYGW